MNLASGLGRIGFLIWHYKTHPGYYAIQSAPWYTEILAILTATGIVAAATTIARWALGLVGRKK